MPEPSSAPADLRHRLLAFSRELVVGRERRGRRLLAGVTLILVLGIGFVDFQVGFEISLLVFYCLPVVVAVAALSWRFGVVVSFASVATWIAGDIAAGADYSRVVPWWNAVIALVTYLVVVLLFHTVLALERAMERRVAERTAALTAEIRERERLERAVLEITERERRSIGHDLHDGLGQHLTGTAFAGQVLAEKLQARELPEEEADAWKLVHLVEDGIEKTRRLAKGLLLAEVQREGLVDALQELATTTSAQFRVTCTFRTEGDCDVGTGGAATHLLRIAQEAVRNAIRHGGARRIEIALRGDAAAVELTVRADGREMPPPAARGEGLGLRIMAHRARLIGGVFTIASPTGGGTLASCRLRRSAP